MGSGASAPHGEKNKEEVASDIASIIRKAFSGNQLAGVAHIRTDSELLSLIFDKLEDTTQDKLHSESIDSESIADQIRKAHVSQDGSQDNQPTEQEVEADQWLCEKCSKPKEDKMKSFCLKCASWGGFGTIQGDGDVPFPENFVQEDDGDQTPGWICGNCDHKNEVDATYCAKCATVHARAMHVKTVGTATMAILSLDQVEVIDGKKAKTKVRLDGHSGEITTDLDVKEETDGNTGSVTTKVTTEGETVTTVVDAGPDKKDDGKWVCDSCQAKNFDHAPYCQNCARVRQGRLPLAR